MRNMRSLASGEIRARMPIRRFRTVVIDSNASSRLESSEHLPAGLPRAHPSCWDCRVARQDAQKPGDPGQLRPRLTRRPKQQVPLGELLKVIGLVHPIAAPLAGFLSDGERPTEFAGKRKRFWQQGVKHAASAAV